MNRDALYDWLQTAARDRHVNTDLRIELLKCTKFPDAFDWTMLAGHLGDCRSAGMSHTFAEKIILTLNAYLKSSGKRK